MKLVEFQWHPTERQLKQFGWVALVMLPLLAWFWGGSGLLIGSFAGVGGVLAALGMLRPAALKPVFLGLSLLFLPLGLVLGELLVLCVYAIAIVPLGLVFRILGRDRLQLKIDRDAPSYWNEKPRVTNPRRYFRQY